MSDSIEKKEWANPSPAGLVALAVACFGFFASLTGLVDSSASLLLGIWLLGGFVVQIIVGIIDLKCNNTSGGNVFLYFSAFFMLVGGIEFITKFLCGPTVLNIAIDTRIDGWAWMCLTIVTVFWSVAFLKAPKPLFFVVLFLDIALPFITLMDLRLISRDFAIIPAIALLIAGLWAIYLGAAIVINATFNKTLLHIPKPFIK